VTTRRTLSRMTPKTEMQEKDFMALGSTASDGQQRPPSTPNVRAYTVRICDDCYALKGEECNNPDCVFIRRTMQEVEDFLDLLLIRPKVSGADSMSGGTCRCESW
jgi:hypothetical protein